MKRVKLLFINVIVLTLESLLIRSIGISFNVYLAAKIGAAGIGLFQLIMSIYILAITFSSSGIRLTTMRLVAEELGLGRYAGAKKSVKNCLTYSLLLSFIFAILLFTGSKFIGTVLLCDERTILSLRILSFSLPFVAASSVFGGYFTAVRKALKASSVQLLEQIVKISVTLAILVKFLPYGLEYACASIVIGALMGELVSFSILSILYITDIRRYKNEGKASYKLLSRMFRIALPVSLSAYITSTIRTVQQLLIPYGLRKSGESSEMALSTYGTIQGMVMPVIMFPSVLLDSIADLIVPELAECKACGNNVREGYIVTRILRIGMLTSICVMSILLCYSNELSLAIYKNGNTAYFIKILAPLIPIFYLDMLVDSMLKGIGQQVSAMRFNIIEAVLSVTLLYILLPRYAIGGYIFTIFITRALNFWLSINRLIKNIDIKISILEIFKSLFCAACALQLTKLFYYMFGFTSLTIHILIIVVIYTLLLRFFSCVTHEDLIWAKKLFK